MHLEPDLDRVSDQADIPHSGHKQPTPHSPPTNTQTNNEEHNKHTGKHTQMHTIFRDPYFTTPFTKHTGPFDHSKHQLFEHSAIRLFNQDRSPPTHQLRTPFYSSILTCLYHYSSVSTITHQSLPFSPSLRSPTTHHYSPFFSSHVHLPPASFFSPSPTSFFLPTHFSHFFSPSPTSHFLLPLKHVTTPLTAAQGTITTSPPTTSTSTPPSTTHPANHHHPQPTPHHPHPSTHHTPTTHTHHTHHTPFPPTLPTRFSSL